MRYASVVMIVFVAILGSSFAQAQSSSYSAPSRKADEASQMQNPYTVAEFGVGLFTLPTSVFELTRLDTRTRGEAIPYSWVWMLYRVTDDFAIGAGSSLAIPFSKEITEHTSEIKRSHKRQYLLIDATARYYGLRLPGIDGWIGATLGGAVISDQFRTEAATTGAVILGPSGVVVRTEGLSAGATAGLSWVFLQNWTVEGSVRVAWWFLPSDRECGMTGDCATLSNGVLMMSAGVGIGYRVWL
ncbi:MAG: hypothetical protein FWD57_06885 [Polyangiaceae bacterium]|nr:hypothetical protein [Polyangiaceae bacterium]